MKQVIKSAYNSASKTSAPLCYAPVFSRKTLQPTKKEDLQE